MFLKNIKYETYMSLIESLYLWKVFFLRTLNPASEMVILCKFCGNLLERVLSLRPWHRHSTSTESSPSSPVAKVSFQQWHHFSPVSSSLRDVLGSNRPLETTAQDASIARMQVNSMGQSHAAGMRRSARARRLGLLQHFGQLSL